MHRILLILLLITLALGGCTATVWVLQPTVGSVVHAWVQAETRTDPVDDLVRFRKAERGGRAGTVLLPVFIILSLALLLLLLTTPLPRILKELRLLRRAGRKSRRQAAHPHAWLEQPLQEQHQLMPPGAETQGRRQQPTSLTGHMPPENQSLLPPPQPNGWLENE